MLDDTLNLSSINDQVSIPKKGKKQKDHLSIEQILHKMDKQEESETQVKKIKLHHQKSSPTVKAVFPEENHYQAEHPPLIKLANLVLQERSPSKTSRLNYYPDLNSDLSPEALYQIHQPSPVIKLHGLPRGSFGEERTFGSASQPRFSNLNPSNPDFNYNFIQTPMGQLLPRISRVHHDHSPSLLMGGDGTNRSSYNNLPGSFQSRILKITEGDSSPESQQMIRFNNVNSERIRHSSLQRNMSMKLNLPKIILQEGNIHSSSGLATVTPNRQHAYLNYQDSPQTRQDRVIHHRRTDRDGGYQSVDMSTGTRSSIKIPSTRRQFDFAQAAQHVDLSTERAPSSQQNTPKLLPSNLGIESSRRPAFHRKSMTREFTNISENGSTQIEGSFKLERHLSDQQPRKIDNQHLDDKSRLSRIELRTSIFRKIAQNGVLKTQPN